MEDVRAPGLLPNCMFKAPSEVEMFWISNLSSAVCFYFKRMRFLITDTVVGV
jgi:hypothetical protein